MSRTSHAMKGQSRRDCLESWVYVSLELFDLEALPWRYYTQNKRILHKKERFVKGKYVSKLNSFTARYLQMLQYIDSLEFKDKPDYAYLQSRLQLIRVENKVDFNLPFDWEELSL